MKLVVVPHGAKVVGVKQYAPELAADPPMTMEGKAKILTLVPALMALGPYDGVYCSLMDRACGSMCTIVKQMNVRRVTCIDELGQYGNLDGDGTVIAYPGHEADDVLTWRNQGLLALRIIGKEVSYKTADGRALVFTHRPILAGLVATATYTYDPPSIQKILDAKELTGKGFRVFEYDGKNLKMLE